MIHPNKGYSECNTPYSYGVCREKRRQNCIIGSDLYQGKQRSLLVSALALDWSAVRAFRSLSDACLWEIRAGSDYLSSGRFRITEVRRKGNRFVEILDGTVETQNFG